MTSLIDFIEARIAEDEQIARAAYGETEQDWTIDTDPDLPAKHVQGRPSIKTSGMGWQTTSGDGIWSCDDPEDDCRIYRREDKADAEHIVHFDPARVLREVAAKRAIIKAHPIDTEYDHLSACRACQWDVDCDAPRNDLEASDCPCPSLRAVATVYSSHPDYREEWAA